MKSQKKITFWIVFLLCISFVPLAQAIEELFWTSVTLPEPVPTDPSIPYRLGIWFYGDFGWINAGQKLWITRDGGRSWTSSLVAPQGRKFYDSYFINPLEGWAVLDSFPSRLFRTHDGGKTWKTMEVKLIRTSPKPAGDVYLTYIYFKDLMHGLGIFPVDGFPHPLTHIIARTDDGGENWTEIRVSGGSKLIGIGEKVWVVYGDGAKALFTPNFGNDFRELLRHLILPDFLPSYAWSLDYSFLDKELWRWEVVSTSDDGLTWSSIWDIRGPILSFNLYLCLIREGVGAILWLSTSKDVKERGRLYFTSDGGISWTQYTVPVVSGYRLACNRERQELWLVPTLEDGERNILFRASIPHLTEVRPSGKLPTLWGAIKLRKEF